VAALVGGFALLGGTAQAADWSTIARASDTGRNSTLAHIGKSLTHGGVFRLRVKAPRGQVRVSGHLTCYYSENDTEYAERDVAWSWRSPGYHYRWHRQRLPQALTLGPTLGGGTRCIVRLDASGNGGRLGFELQRYAGPMYGWSTIARASDAGKSATLAHIGRTVPEGTYRVRAKAPAGRAKLYGSLACAYVSRTDHRDLAWSWRSRGFRYAWHGQRLPGKLTYGAVSCDVTLNASGKGGRLALQLQRLIPLFPAGRR
jgi:hypothetical protein